MENGRRTVGPPKALLLVLAVFLLEGTAWAPSPRLTGNCANTAMTGTRI